MLRPQQPDETLGRDWIVRHIPHQGTMCLLDRVDFWDELSVTCRTTSHRQDDNPLRSGGRLGAACGIEYAAQAMAVHGALMINPDSPGPRAGFLVSVRDVHLDVSRLDDVPGDLLVSASCNTRGETTSLYQFSLEAEGRLLVSGRALVVLDSDSLVTSGETLT